MVDTFGNKEGLLIEIDWDEGAPTTAAEATRGSLRLWAHNEIIWPGPDADGFEWTWIELAEHLAWVWAWIRWENGFPLELQGGNLNRVEADLQRRWSGRSLVLRGGEEQDVYTFKERHDLAEGVSGALMPSVWVVREGSECWISTASGAALQPFDAIDETLTAFIEALLARVSATVTDSRGQALQEAWARRLSRDLDTAIEIATGMTDERIEKLQAGEAAAEFWEVNAENFELTELLAAARMTAALTTDDIGTTLAAIRSASVRQTSELDELAVEAVERLPSGPDWFPYDQGYAAAHWLRSRLGIDSEGRVDPEKWLQNWNVEVTEVTLATGAVDALATWGPRHGPAVFVNVHGNHTRSLAARRATLAHEICHLLLDRSAALPLTEVMGGRSPAGIEERARAFAAELLLPRNIAGEQLALSPDPMHTVRALSRRYGVSTEIVAWQARNSPIDLSESVRSVLRRTVSRPWAF